jgi:uncharacterized protein YdeI (YjbR/CyaY-like superfamily)
MATDPRIDAYIAKAAPFARPILHHLRAVVRDACPGAEETIKWGSPAFVYQNKLLCMIAAFKAHCALVLWTREREKDASRLRQITSVKELPSPRVLGALVKAAAKRIADGTVVPKPVKKPKPPVKVPDDLKAALALDARARAGFEKLPPSHRREYIEWIIEAKTEPTRERRLATTLEWVAEGKSRNWKYGRA